MSFFHDHYYYRLKRKVHRQMDNHTHHGAGHAQCGLLWGYWSLGSTRNGSTSMYRQPQVLKNRLLIHLSEIIAILTWCPYRLFLPPLPPPADHTLRVDRDGPPGLRVIQGTMLHDEFRIIINMLLRLWSLRSRQEVSVTNRRRKGKRRRPKSSKNCSYSSNRRLSHTKGLLISKMESGRKVWGGVEVKGRHSSTRTTNMFATVTTLTTTTITTATTTTKDRGT